MEFDIFYRRSDGSYDHSVIESVKLSTAVAYVEEQKGGEVYKATVRNFAVNDFAPIEHPEEKGYDIVDREGAMEVQRLDSAGVFVDDEAAVNAAIRDGVPIIPVDDLPDSFPYRWLGWLDTPKNWRAIRHLCEKQKSGLQLLELK